MKKRYLPVLSICLVLGIAFIAFFIWKEAKKKEEFDILKVTERWVTESKPQIIGIDWLHDDQWLLVSAKSQKLPKNYYKDNKSFEFETTSPVIGLTKLILIDQKRFTSTSRGNKPSFSTNYQIEVYSIGKKAIKKIKTIDLEKKVKAINKSFSMDNVYNFTYDEKFVEFSVHGDEEFYYLRLADEKILKESEMDPTILEKTKENEKVPAAYEFISTTNFQNREIVDGNGLRAIQTVPNRVLGIRYKGKDQVKPSLLEERYPEIKKIYSNNGFGRLIYSQVPPTAEELAKLMVPKGEDPWQGVTLEARSSKDGKEHDIHSIDEFLKWYQPYDLSKKQKDTSNREEFE